MTKIINWIKTHKLVILLVLVIFYLFSKNSRTTSLNGGMNFTLPQSAPTAKIAFDAGGGNAGIVPFREAASVTNPTNRMVIKESNISLLVSNVVSIQKKILNKVSEIGGYMVNSSINNPQEQASATIIVRVPTKELERALTYFRSLSVKVVSEYIQGDDVTDQYVDLEKQLETLSKTILKFEQMLDKATEVADILNVQRELMNIQSQIDSIKGQQQYYEKSAEMAKVIIYLSTDELSLPYAPTETWRPQVIFKEAVKSLIITLRSFGSSIIWIAVYAVIWIPILLIVYFINKKYSKKSI